MTSAVRTGERRPGISGMKVQEKAERVLPAGFRALKRAAAAAPSQNVSSEHYSRSANEPTCAPGCALAVTSAIISSCRSLETP